MALRAGLVEISQAKRSVDGPQGKMELIYNYLSGPEFRHRIEGVVEGFVAMKADLDAEKKAMQRIDDFKKNPQDFIDLAGEAINRAKRLAIVDGVKYQRIGDDCFYAQELFEQEELTGYLKNMLDVTKAIYEQVVYDSSGIERQFAEQLEKNEAVKVYAKLPGWFKVPTPLGTYNPDWAVLVNTDGQERLYFVVETKAGLFADDLREKENAKIHCGKAHFQAISVGENPAKFKVVTKLDELL